ncbi:MAG: hypothetical protein KAT43_03400 [Nanoarchaeota archaeon]|nr:hypothetical protein [Nanoarchaeota archaeon]
MKVYLIIAILILSIFLTACAPEAPIEDSVQEPVEDQAQEPEAAPEPAPQPRMTSTIAPARDLTGTWKGSITFTNNCANPACRYIGKVNPPSIIMNLQQNGNNVAGNVILDFANFEIEELVEGMGCDTFAQMVDQGARIPSPVAGTVSSSKFTFTDVGGNFWELMLTTDLMQGTIKNDAPGCMGIESNNVKLSRKRFD